MVAISIVLECRDKQRFLFVSFKKLSWMIYASEIFFCLIGFLPTNSLKLKLVFPVPYMEIIKI